MMKGLPSGVRRQLRPLRSPRVQGAGWAETENAESNGRQARRRTLIFTGGINGQRLKELYHFYHWEPADLSQVPP